MSTGTLIYVVRLHRWRLEIHTYSSRYHCFIGYDVSPALSPAEILGALSEPVLPIVDRNKIDDVQIMVRRNDGSNVGVLSVIDGAITAVLPKNCEGAPT